MQVVCISALFILGQIILALNYGVIIMPLPTISAYAPILTIGINLVINTLSNDVGICTKFNKYFKFLLDTIKRNDTSIKFDWDYKSMR